MIDKDTVMNDDLIKVWVLEFIQPGKLDFNGKLKEFATAQAKLSFPLGEKQGRKVGIREVAEWVERALLCHPDNRRLFRDEWQAKLKE